MLVNSINIVQHRQTNDFPSNLMSYCRGYFYMLYFMSLSLRDCRHHLVIFTKTKVVNERHLKELRFVGHSPIFQKVCRVANATTAASTIEMGRAGALLCSPVRFGAPC